jgi:hypothetical protein
MSGGMWALLSGVAMRVEDGAGCTPVEDSMAEGPPLISPVVKRSLDVLWIVVQ